MTASVSLPKKLYGPKIEENLRKLMDVRGHLIAAAFDTKEINMEVDESNVTFIWDTEHEDQLSCYMDFLARMCKMVDGMNRVNSKPKEVENEKYTFRAFLLRLGYLGDEYKSQRKELLKYLDGDSASKTRRYATKDTQ